MASCKKATFLIEKQQFKQLTLGEQVKLKVHLTACSWCRGYEKQSKHIQLLMNGVFVRSAARTKTLEPAFKNKLQILISTKLKNE